MAETHWATEEDIERWETKQREKSASNGHVRAPPNGHVRAPPNVEPATHYTKVPNWLFDQAGEKDLDAPSTVVLLQICRLTHGMHKATTAVSIEQLAVRCNFSPATCKRALNRLADVGLIRREKRTDKGGRNIASELGLVLDT